MLATLAIGTSTTTCHQFHACYDDYCEPSGSGGTDDEGMGAAGRSPGAGGSEHTVDAGGQHDHASEGGAAVESAGAGGVADDCAPPLADCDDSKLTRCEANLAVDLAHCGACRARCVGACVEGTCQAFETLAVFVEPPATDGIAVGPNELFVLSTNQGFSSDLLRWSEAGGAQTLFSQGAAFKGIVAGPDRIYLLGTSSSAPLSSVPLAGGAVVTEGAPTRKAVIVGGDVYAVDASGMPYVRGRNGTRTDLPLPSPLPTTCGNDGYCWTDAALSLATDGDDIVLAVGSTKDDEPKSYSLYLLTHPSSDEEAGWRIVSTNDGSPGQLRAASHGGTLCVYLDVVLDAPDYYDPEAPQLVHELRETCLDGPTRVVTTARGLLNFELVSRRLYLSRTLPGDESSLRIVPLGDPSLMLEVQTSSSMASLTYSSPYFYFGSSKRRWFSRMRSWLESD